MSDEENEVEKYIDSDQYKSNKFKDLDLPTLVLYKDTILHMIEKFDKDIKKYENENKKLLADATIDTKKAWQKILRILEDGNDEIKKRITRTRMTAR